MCIELVAGKCVCFQSANEMYQNQLIKLRTSEIQSQLESEKAWWEKKRAGIQSEFMKEIEEDGRPIEPTQKKTGSSDEDAVLVEAGGPAQAQGGGGGKKKKGKK